MEIVACLRRGEAARIPRQLGVWVGIPVAIAGVAWWLATPELPFWAQILVTLALVTAARARCSIGSPTSRWPRPACWSS